MAEVISITITESTEQLLSGIPKYVELSTNTPATIFYTLDGTDPGVTSEMYVTGQLEMPTNQTTVIFKVFATDGTDTSPIITKTYQPDVDGIHRPHDSAAVDYSGDSGIEMFPYGDNSPEPPAVYDGTGLNIVDDPTIDNIYGGYDADGNPALGTDQPLDTYQLVFSESNETGERGHGIGTMPSTTTLDRPEEPPAISDANSAFFDPRAMVIYQDNTKEPYDPTLSRINRQLFTLDNSERIKDGTTVNTTSIEGLVATGSMLRQHYNPRDNTINFYYMDSQNLRWIICKEPYTPTSDTARNGLASVVFSSRDPGSNFVYKWFQFVGRRLI
jgi:hypothetical protein